MAAIKQFDALTYDDVLLVPQYSDIESRKEIDISSQLGKLDTLTLPIFASPMDTVCEDEMALAMMFHGGMGIVHRYMDIQSQIKVLDKVFKTSIQNQYLDKHSELKTKDHVMLVGVAVGATGDYLERAQECVKAGATLVCIDVAHGHHIHVKRAIESLKRNLPGDIQLMAGNVATKQAFDDLADWGAEIIRCNIGGGSICTTRVETGHGVPGLETVIDCSRSHHAQAGNVKIVADGGIKNAGDIVKAMAAGADFVMLGSLLAGHDEAPGRLFQTTDGSRKEYRGMASVEAQLAAGRKPSSLEGIASSVPSKGPVHDTLEYLENNIRSGFSYTGARNIQELREKAVFVRQTNAGQVESSAHILKR